MKRKMEEDKILEAVSQRMKLSGGSVATHQLTNVLEQMADNMDSASSSQQLFQ